MKDDIVLYVVFIICNWILWRFVLSVYIVLKTFLSIFGWYLTVSLKDSYITLLYYNCYKVF